jgi:cellulose synthase/poly-beta-1,6-N-acetylglucosamine synthase-like glycosyltransferase/peptidoglycan/xylan/chitin deacetylase (PgdA/CDA1 family)
MQNKPVFFDPTGRRATRLSRLRLMTAVISTVLVAVFVASLLIGTRMNTLALSNDRTRHPMTGVKATAPGLLKSAAALAAQVRARQQGVPRASRMRGGHVGPTRALPIGISRPVGRPVSIGFYVNWDDGSYASLRRELPKLDWVVPSWLSLQGPDMALKIDLDTRSLDLIRREKPTIAILPMLQNAVGGNWEGAGLQRLLADPAARHVRIAQIVEFLGRNKLQGVTIDFETVPAAAQPNLREFLTEMQQAFAPHGWGIVLAMPFDDPSWDYAAYADIVDFEMLMAYDEHWEDGSAGSIAGQSWFERTLDTRMKVLDPDRVIVAIGAYAYDWGKEKSATDESFQEAVSTARDAEADVSFDPETENPHYSYTEDGTLHQVWFLDGVTAFNQIHAADVYQPYGYAVWRLGSEDPSLWSVMSRPYGAPAPAGLRTISSGQDVDVEGKGEILQISSTPTSGARDLDIDKSYGDINDETYTKFPQSYVIQRYGSVPHKIALTFDDGPDASWTPEILDILKSRHVPATFFIVGENAQSSPGLVQRMVDEGHVVGNHTYTHPNLGETPARLVELELNATQRLFEALTGRSMRLFRAPFFGDAEPTTADELIPIEQAQSMGYLSVGLQVDPNDWERPGAAAIVSRVLEQVSDPDPEKRGQIVLLHDGGGDRSQTVAALPILIDRLRARGYQLVSVAELAGLTRDQAMSPLPPESFSRFADRSVFLMLGWAGHVLRGLFMAAIGLGIGRLLFLGAFGLLNWHRDRQRIAPELPIDPALVSVLIPAYNEALVIVSSIEQILKSSYPRLELIVIDDGSTDATSQVVSERFASDSRVRLISIPNGGKANAINTALLEARGEVVVALDADTQFEPETISKLVRWFVDPAVGAVAGNAKVGNRVNVITYWQALEYITAQNLERRALAALGAITVVPGAIGAWRRTALDGLGGFPADTLAEDQDLTIAIQKAGYQVLFDGDAVAWTEAPDSMRGLARQRFRWAYGTLQCLWKHRDMTFRRRYGALGMVALPQVWLFQILFSVVSPLVDLLLVWQVIATGLDYLQHRAQFNSDNLIEVAVFYAIFMLVDLAASAIAFAMEKREKWSLLWWLVLQRFGYRQLMYYVVIRSVSAALRGPSVGWGQHERKGSVRNASIAVLAEDNGNEQDLRPGQ